MNKFRMLGFIDYNGDLKAHNSLLNAIFYDVPGFPRELRTPDLNHPCIKQHSQRLLHSLTFLYHRLGSQASDG